MAFLRLSHNDPLSLTDAIMEYEANDGCFSYLSHRINSRWMHLSARMSIIADLVSRPVPSLKPINIVVIEEGLISRDKNSTIESSKSLIITDDIFEAMQYSYMLKNVKHCIIKSQRKRIPKMDIIITPKCYASCILNGTTFHRIIFPFNFNQRQLVFKKCKFSYSLSQFCIFYDWQVFQTFVLEKTFKIPNLTFLKALKSFTPYRVCLFENTFICHFCKKSQLTSVWHIGEYLVCKACKILCMCKGISVEKYKSQSHYLTIDQHLLKFMNSRCIIFDDRSQQDFYREYSSYQQELKTFIHTSPPINIERCDTKAFDKIVIVCSIDLSLSSFLKSIRQICYDQVLDLYLIYTHKKMKTPYTTQFST